MPRSVGSSLGRLALQPDLGVYTLLHSEAWHVNSRAHSVEWETSESAEFSPLQGQIVWA
jgi:hypothetical protein